MREYTVREFADREKVTCRTVWTWIAKKAIQVRHTPGGGVRVLILDTKPSSKPLKSNEV